MNINLDKTRTGTGLNSSIPTLDLNDLLLDHPAASFILRLETNLSPECVAGDYLIVDRATLPYRGCLALIELPDGFSVEVYDEQIVFGVVTYQLHKTA